MTEYVRGANPIWYFPDLTGEPLNDEYYAFFLSNTLPYIEQTVYHDPNGLTPWSNPVQFLASGTLPNNIYFDDSLTYRIQIRRGNTQADALIWDIENYFIGTGDITPVSDPLITSENMITNPQFVDISFVSGNTISTAGTYEIAPGWVLVTSGVGTTTLTQGTNAGSSQIDGNPSYYIEFNSSGWDSIYLYQRLANNGSIFGGGAVALSVTARTTTDAHNLTVSYVPSAPGGNSQNIINNANIAVGSFIAYKNAIDIDPSTNTDTGSSAYVDIKFDLPETGIMALTNIQLTGQSEPLSTGFDVDNDPPDYQELTYERMVDHEFNVYRNATVYQPKDSILAGWQFATNPWQFRSPSSANVATNEYTADQTILIQQNYVASAAGNNVAVGRATYADNYAYQVTAVTATNKFAIIQYIDPAIVRPFWGKKLSARLNAEIVTSHSSSVKVKMRLIYNASVPGSVSQTEPISVWANTDDVVPTFNAGNGWTAIAPMNDPAYELSDGSIAFSFDRFTLPAATSDNMTLGIVLFTLSNMDETATADKILIHDISLVNNDYAIKVQSDTWDESLKKCEYYYEKSYDPSVIPTVGTSTLNALTAPMQMSGTNGLATTFSFEYKTVKRESSPTIRIHSISSASTDKVTASFWRNGASDTTTEISHSTNWTLVYKGAKGVVSHATVTGAGTIVTGSGTSNNPQSFIEYHYTVDARIGK